MRSLGFPSHAAASVCLSAGVKRREGLFQGEWGSEGIVGWNRHERRTSSPLSAPNRRHSALHEMCSFLEISLLIVFALNTKLPYACCNTNGTEVHSEKGNFHPLPLQSSSPDPILGFIKVFPDLLRKRKL